MTRQAYNEGKSKYRINITVTQSDVDNWGMAQELVGTTVHHTPVSIGNITGLDDKKIIQRINAADRAKANGKKYRSAREIAGLDDFNRVINERELRSPTNEKKRFEAANTWLLGRA